MMAEGKSGMNIDKSGGKERKFRIALLGQPNSGKSTLFNGLTGARQHVGNWPGKTVEKKAGTFTRDGVEYEVVDLPGTYSLVANSDEEVVTRDYIENGNADLVCILADASQLERSLFMLADYTGIRVPAVLILNLMDVAENQGKQIDCHAIEKQLGIPVLPFVASGKKDYDSLYRLLRNEKKKSCCIREDALKAGMQEKLGAVYQEAAALLPEDGITVYSVNWILMKLLEKDRKVQLMVEAEINGEKAEKLQKLCSSVTNGSLKTGDCKYHWIDSLLAENTKGMGAVPKRSRFDQIATSRRWGKPMAILMVLAGLMLSMIVAAPIMGIGGMIQYIGSPLAQLLVKVNVAPLLISLVCDGVVTAVSFAVMMSGFVFGISFVFGFMEEIGYMARVSYVFDGAMQRMGLQGKAIMPFLVSFGCNIGGASGTRVLDSWGQRVLTIAMSWVVPCGSTWGVVGLMAALFFGKGAGLVVMSLFLVALLHMYITYKIYGKALLKDTDRSGLLMELPPYHKPRWGSLLKYVWNRMLDVLKRALGLITLVSLVFCLLSYTPGGSVEGSLIYRIGTFIEPVTMFFGLRWQMFMAWASSAMGKEASLGVLAALFRNAGIWTGITQSTSVDTAILGESLLQTISRPEALAFTYAFFFNIPCLMALSAAVQETHSLKWVLKIALYYIAASLILAGIVYHIGLLIF